MIQLSGVDWWPAVAILLAGAVVGIMLARRSSSRGKESGIAPDRGLADLAARRDVLVEQLRSFEGTPEERAALELETARTLRAIELAGPPAPRPPARQLGSSAAHYRGFLWGAGTVTALALVIFLVTRSTTPRSEGAPVTGDAGFNAGLAEADFARLQKAVQQAPNDLELRLDLARAHLVREQLLQAFEHSQYVLERDPGNPRALSYQAIVRLAMGEAEVALEMLNQALARDPDSLEARVHLALVHATMGDSAAAIASVEEAMRRHPEERERLTGLIEQIRTSGAPAGAPGAEKRIEMTIEVAPGVRPPAGAILFVVARPAGVTEGAPLAVKRLAVSRFPMKVTLSSADSMMGGQLTKRLRIDARIDADGDAATRSESDLRAGADNVALGTTDLRLVLR